MFTLTRDSVVELQSVMWGDNFESQSHPHLVSLHVERLKPNWASAVSELDVQMLYGELDISTGTISIEVYCFRVVWRELIECYVHCYSFFLHFEFAVLH